MKMDDFDPKPFNEENIREKTWVAWEGEREGGRERGKEGGRERLFFGYQYRISLL